MAWKEKTYHLKSLSPLLVHNGQTADPLNKYSKAMKEVTAKRKKTEADYEEMSHIEFLASLYMGKDENGNIVPVIPANNIEATLIASAKKFKEGVQAKAGMIVPKNAILQYNGSKNPEEMFRDDSFRDVRAVAVNRARIMRTRAIFNEWEADITIQYEDSVINGSRIDEWVRTAGTLIGICEMRPKFGRFEVK